jgi:2-methylcitrate dehydratase
MGKISFEHGGKEYDEKYPEGIPTSLTVKFKNGIEDESGFIMFPEGHASCISSHLENILIHKF